MDYRASEDEEGKGKRVCGGSASFLYKVYNLLWGKARSWASGLTKTKNCKRIYKTKRSETCINEHHTKQIIKLKQRAIIQ